MAEKRKLAKDWRDSYKQAKTRVEKIENQIKERLVELCRQYPNTVIGRRANSTDDSMVLARELRDDVKEYTANDCIVFIDIIETCLAAQHPHQQSEIKFSDFIEYEDNGDNYEHPERTEVAEILDIRLYCMHEGCNRYIRGKEGYNGAFTAETGQYCDLRNQGFSCKEHSSKESKDYCNCDKRDMPIYEEDGKNWCPQCGNEVL